MNEKIPNYFYDCFKFYLAFNGEKAKFKTFEEFYNKNKDFIFGDGMTDDEICKTLNIGRNKLKDVLFSAYRKIRKYERKLGLEIFD